MKMKTGEAGIALIKRNEGCRLKAYKDIVGVWTIGYGDTKDVRPGQEITQAEAEARLFRRLMYEFEPAVLATIGDAPTTQNQFDAMISLAWNIGCRGFDHSSVAHCHVYGDYAGAQTCFALWNKAGGRVNSGLVRRRAEEAKLYGTPPVPVQAPQAPPAPTLQPKPDSAPTTSAGPLAAILNTVKGLFS